MNLIDSHAHLTSEEFNEDRLFILRDLSNFSIEAVINPGVNLENSRENVRLAKEFKNFYAQVGIHPSDVEEMGENDLTEIEKLAKDAVAIGEIGLDYYWTTETKDLQKKVFIAQLEMARKLGKPVVIHNREATEDIMEILANYKDLKVQIHCFSTDEETLKTFMDWGFYISIGGVVTYNTGLNEKAAAALVPIERLMLETDSPYLTPEPYRGMRNDPRKIIEVARKIAEIRGMKLSKVAKWTSKNAREFFNL
ncbi:TatD family hydrolase [uncultured Anaerococcus sp.]|uniref:TatD family hydrolase n=1 Tax=uncultured Anaerococcus sp. TaxID=293428 RepID=UPI00288B06A1|nr:TatD family hydrolase [uncultured Anaerococcus sp.]